jgi:hypothetical protein
MKIPGIEGFESAPGMRVPSEEMLEAFDEGVEVSELSQHEIVAEASNFLVGLDSTGVSEGKLEEATKHFDNLHKVLPFLEKQTDDTEYSVALETMASLQKKFPSLNQ